MFLLGKSEIMGYEMIPAFNKLILSIVFSSAFILSTAAVCRSQVVVFDRVTTVQTPIRIKVLTKGRFFSQGGRLVDIYLDDNLLKKILTGGDGYGYLKYIPQSPGIKKIRARSDANSSSGLLLVMRESDKAIIIEVEGAFKDTIFSEGIRDNSRKAVDSLSKAYTIIYLSKYVGKGISRGWLDKEDFPESAILRWQGTGTFKALEDKRVSMHAVIGSAAVISAAEKYIENRYTFEKSKDGKMVKDWDEILKLLLPAAPADSPKNDPKSTIELFRPPIFSNGTVGGHAIYGPVAADGDG